MVLQNLLSKAVPIARGFSTSPVQRHAYRGVVGSNLPFQIKNRYRLLAVFILYFGSGLGLPFITLRHMILAKNQS